MRGSEERTAGGDHAPDSPSERRDRGLSRPRLALRCTEADHRGRPAAYPTVRRTNGAKPVRETSRELARIPGGPATGNCVRPGDRRHFAPRGAVDAADESDEHITPPLHRG